MKIIFHRVWRAVVTSEDNKEIVSIGKGMMVYIAFNKGDNKKTIQRFAPKCLKLRVWREISKDNKEAPKEVHTGELTKTMEENKADEAPQASLKRWETSVLDNGYEVMIVPMSPLNSIVEDDEVIDKETLSQKEKEELMKQFMAELVKGYREDRVKMCPFGFEHRLDFNIDGPVTLLAEGQ